MRLRLPSARFVASPAFPRPPPPHPSPQLGAPKHHCGAHLGRGGGRTAGDGACYARRWPPAAAAAAVAGGGRRVTQRRRGLASALRLGAASLSPPPRASWPRPVSAQVVLLGCAWSPPPHCVMAPPAGPHHPLRAPRFAPVTPTGGGALQPAACAATQPQHTHTQQTGCLLTPPPPPASYQTPLLMRLAVRSQRRDAPAHARTDAAVPGSQCAAPRRAPPVRRARGGPGQRRTASRPGPGADRAGPAVGVPNAPPPGRSSTASYTAAACPAPNPPPPS